MGDDRPWLSMWTNPRRTIRSIVESNPNRSLWVLAFVYGISSMLNGFQSFPIASKIGLIPMLFVAVILAPFWGYAFLSVWSWVVVIVGKMFKGKADFYEARAACAWSCVPLLGNIPLWVLLILFYSDSLFFGQYEGISMTGPMVSLLFLILIGKLVFAIWSIVLYLQALAEVQGFSVLRSIGNIIVGSIFIVIVIAVLVTILGAVFSRGHATIGALESDYSRSIVQQVPFKEEP